MIPKLVKHLFALVLILLILLALAFILVHPWQEPEDPVKIGTVTRVIDGDTFDIEGVGKVRLADVDCPEKGGEEGKAAAEYADNQLLGRKVALEISKDQDKYGRAIAHIYLLSPTGKVGAHFNKMIVVSGHAVIRDYPDTSTPDEWCPELLDRFPVMPYVPGQRMYEIPEWYGKDEGQENWFGPLFSRSQKLNKIATTSPT